MGLKRGERRDIAQGDLGFQGMPKEVLRAIQVSPNDAARASNLVIFPNMRVPDRSIINKIFIGGAPDGAAVEDLAWWESSDGSRLPSARCWFKRVAAEMAFAPSSHPNSVNLRRIGSIAMFLA